MHFFSVYKQLERGKHTEVKAIGGPIEAIGIMEKAMENYREKFCGSPQNDERKARNG